MAIRRTGEAEMTSAIREWLNLGVRWFHVFAGIMWVGQTYYFTWLDGQFGKLEKKAAANGTDSKVWMVHSGGFYTVQKQKSLGVAPEQVRWFRWEALLTWVAGLMHVFSGRAAYIHLGAIFGTIMTVNVWMRILPAQRRMLAAAAAGEQFDASAGAQAKLRSKHNTFMAVPVVFLMLSNHYPVATYGNHYAWEIMLALVVAGWGAAKLIRDL